MKRFLRITAAALGCVFLALIVAGYYAYHNFRYERHRHPFGNFAAWEADFDTLARIVDRSRAEIGEYPETEGDLKGRLLELSGGAVRIFQYPSYVSLPLTDAERQAVRRIRARWPAHYFLRVYDGGFLLTGDNESLTVPVLAHAENRRALRKMIAGKPFDRHTVKLSEQWFCVFERFGSAF